MNLLCTIFIAVFNEYDTFGAYKLVLYNLGHPDVLHAIFSYNVCVHFKFDVSVVFALIDFSYILIAEMWCIQVRQLKCGVYKLDS